jgi:hypothetical protein
MQTYIAGSSQPSQAARSRVYINFRAGVSHHRLLLNVFVYGANYLNELSYLPNSVSILGFAQDMHCSTLDT